MEDERESNTKFSRTLSPKLNFGPSFVINYSMLLWYNCLDNLNIKLSDFRTKQLYQFLFGLVWFLNKDYLFCVCVSREMDGISFSCQMIHAVDTFPRSL